jgi:hypothetical protein
MVDVVTFIQGNLLLIPRRLGDGTTHFVVLDYPAVASRAGKPCFVGRPVMATEPDWRVSSEVVISCDSVAYYYVVESRDDYLHRLGSNSRV